MPHNRNDDPGDNGIILTDDVAVASPNHVPPESTTPPTFCLSFAIDSPTREDEKQQHHKLTSSARRDIAPFLFSRNTQFQRQQTPVLKTYPITDGIYMDISLPPSSWHHHTGGGASIVDKGPRLSQLSKQYHIHLRNASKRLAVALMCDMAPMESEDPNGFPIVENVLPRQQQQPPEKNAPKHLPKIRLLFSYQAGSNRKMASSSGYNVLGKSLHCCSLAEDQTNGALIAIGPCQSLYYATVQCEEHVPLFDGNEGALSLEGSSDAASLQDAIVAAVKRSVIGTYPSEKEYRKTCGRTNRDSSDTSRRRKPKSVRMFYFSFSHCPLCKVSCPSPSALISIHLKNQSHQKTRRFSLDFYSCKNTIIEHEQLLRDGIELSPQESAFLGWICVLGETNWSFQWKLSSHRPRFSPHQRRDFTENRIQPSFRSEKFFVDSEFPPSLHSITLNSTRWMRKLRLDTQNIVWKPIVTSSSNSPILTVQHVDGFSILQGRYLGNCWHLAALTAIAHHHPRLIEKIFITKLIQSSVTPSHAMYEMQFFKNGHWVKVCVDPFVPHLQLNDASSTLQPLFAHYKQESADEGLWLLLLEKAYAKLHGSYVALYGGHPFVAFHDMIAHPVQCLWIEQFSVQQLCNLLFQFHKQRYLLCASSSKGDIIKRVGLREAHAYTILDILETGKGTNDHHHLVKDPSQTSCYIHLQDPQGEHRFTNNVLPETLLQRNSDDTACSFCIDMRIFIQCFVTLHVCLYDPTRKVQAQKLPIEWDTHHSSNCYIIETPKSSTAEIFIGLSQDCSSSRTSKSVPIGARLFASRESILLEEPVAEIGVGMPQEIRYTDAISLASNTVFYLVASHGWSDTHSQIPDSHFVIHASQKLCIEQHEDTFAFSNMLQSQEWLLRQTLQLGTVFSEKPEYGIQVLEYIHEENICFAVCFEGAVQTTGSCGILRLLVKPRCNNIQNVKVLPCSSADGQGIFKLRPGEKALVFRGVVNPEESFSYKFSYSYKIVRRQKSV